MTEAKQKVVSTVKNNKKIVISITSVFAVLVIIRIVLNILSASPVGQAKLKNYLAGESVYIDSKTYKLSQNNIEDLDIISRHSKNKQYDSVKCSMNIDLENAKVASNVSFNLIYNEKKKEWVLSGINDFEVESINPKKEIDDNVESMIKNLRIRYNNSYIDWDKIKLNSVSDVKITGENKEREVSAILQISNGIIESKIKISFNVNFDLSTGEWKASSSSITSIPVEKEKIVSSLTDEDKKNFVLSAFTSNDSYSYKYAEYSSKNIYINKANITDLKIVDFMEYKADTIRAEITGTAKNGIVDKINFSGVVYLNSSLDNSSSNKKDIIINSLEITPMDTDNLRKSLLEFRIDNKPITTAMTSTLSITGEDKDSTDFNKIYLGTINVNGITETVKIRCDLEYNSKSNSYEWKVDRLYIIND